MNSLTQVPPGIQILIGDAARRRRAVEKTILSVFEGWSYEEIIPPMFDYFDVFIKGMGHDLEDQIYRFIDREGNLLALRPEFTSLLAKMSATRLSGLPKPVRISYSGEVLRFETPKGGRQREFAQIGIEHYGGDTRVADVEVLLVCMEVLEKLGVSDFQINIGNVDFLGGIVDQAELPEKSIDALKDALDVKDQTSLERLLEDMPFDERQRKILQSIPHLMGDRKILSEMRSLIRNDRSRSAIDHLEEIYSVFESLGLERHLTIDLGEVRGFDYYSGMLFRAYVPGIGFEVANGGRYDGLPAQFGHDMPAVGFSFTLDRLEQIVTSDVKMLEAEVIPSSAGNKFKEAVRLRRTGKAVKLC